MTLDELRALLTPERLDQVAAHNCGASDLALVLASALTDALIERDALRAEVARLTAERDEANAEARQATYDAIKAKTERDALRAHAKGGG